MVESINMAKFENIQNITAPYFHDDQDKERESWLNAFMQTQVCWKICIWCGGSAVFPESHALRKQMSVAL